MILVVFEVIFGGLGAHLEDAGGSLGLILGAFGPIFGALVQLF